MKLSPVGPAGAIEAVAGSKLRVAFEMTFPNRFPVWGFSVYARTLLDALAARSDVAVSEISGPVASDPKQTVRWLTSGAHQELSRRPAHVLHCPAFVTPWRSPAPVVINLHDAAAQRFPQDYPFEWRFYNRFILPAVARRAARIVALSEFARQEAVKYYRVKKARVAVTYAAPGSQYVPQSPEATRQVLADLALLDEEGQRRGQLILFSGAPFSRKNLDVVLKAMAGASQDSSLAQAQLLISGATENSFEHYRTWIAEHGLEGKVRWLGRVPHEAMPALYAAVDLLVYPSIYEGFGLPPLEAMSVGTPVVAAAASCLPEILGDGALMPQPHDHRGFADAIESVLSRPDLRAEMVARGRARAAQYTWQRCADRTVAAYRAARRGSRRRQHAAG